MILMVIQYLTKKVILEKMNQKVLIELHELQKGIITGVKKGTASLLSYLDKEKIKLGDKIQVLEIIEFDGTFIVDINGRKCTFSEKDLSKFIIRNL